MPCGCCQGACCFCVRGFHYYVDATEPTGGTAYQDRTLGALTPPYPEGSWDCQDLYAVDGEDVWVPGNTGGPAGGTFVTKFCHTGGFACRFADWIWDNAEDAGASAPYSAWTREDQLTACVQTSRDECEQCRETVDDLELL